VTPTRGLLCHPVDLVPPDHSQPGAQHPSTTDTRNAKLAPLAGSDRYQVGQRDGRAFSPRNRNRPAVPAIPETCPSGEDIFFRFPARLPRLADDHREDQTSPIAQTGRRNAEGPVCPAPTLRHAVRCSRAEHVMPCPSRVSPELAATRDATPADHTNSPRALAPGVAGWLGRRSRRAPAAPEREAPPGGLVICAITRRATTFALVGEVVSGG